MPTYLTDAPDITTDVLDLRRRISILENKSGSAQEISTASPSRPPNQATSSIPDNSVTYAKLAGDVQGTFDTRYVNVAGDTMTGALAVNAPLTVGTSGNAQPVTITGTLSTTGTGNVGGNLTVGGQTIAKGSIEVGTQGISGTPYVDFHSSISSTDYDARIIATGGTASTGGGNLQILATSLSLPTIGAALTVANTLTVSGAYPTTLGGDLTVQGTTYFNGGFTIAGPLTVGGAATFNGGIASNLYGITDNSYFSWDASQRRIGFSKKAGAIGKVAYANGSFAITQYVGQTSIDPSQPQTDRFVLDASGNATIYLNLGVGSLSVTGASTFTGAAALNGGISTKDIVTGGGGAGIGNLASMTVDTYNIKDQAITAAKLSPGALAASGTPSGTANNGRAKLLRYVTANPATRDAAGQSLDNLLTTNIPGVARVVDSQAYGGNAIRVQANAFTSQTGSIFQYGPYYGSDGSDYVGSPGFAPGQYRVTVYAKVTSAASPLPIVGFDAHCNTAGVVLNDATQYVFKAQELNTYYVGCSFPLYLQADTRNTAGLEIRAYYYTGSGADIRISHIQVEPYSGLSQGEVNDTYIKDLSVTNAKIYDLQANKITAGTIYADITQGGVFRTGPAGSARVELNSGGLYAYGSDGVTTTARILANGQVSVTGTVNATGGNFTGTITGGTFRGGTFETAAGNVSAVRLDTAGLRAYDAGGLTAFNLAADGSLYASNVNISGVVNSTGGSFSGELYGNGITGARISTSRSLATRNPEGANGTADWVDITAGLGAAVTQQSGGPVGAGYAIRFAYGVTSSPASPPNQNIPAVQIGGGTLAAGTYYYVITAYNNIGETSRSNEQAAAATTNGSVVTSWSAVAGATGYYVYRGTTAGGENVRVGTTTGTTLTDTGGGSAGSPPNTNQSGNLRAYSVMGNYLFSSPGVIKNGDLVTVSFYGRALSGDGVVQPSVRHGDGTVPFMPTQAAITLGGGWGRYNYSFTAQSDADQSHLLYLARVNLQQAATLEITGVQVEFGPTATTYGSGQQRVELNSQGMSAYNLAGTRVTFIDSATGILHASGVDLTGTATGTINATGGVFSGNISAQSLTLTGGVFKSTNIDATNLIQGGAIVAGSLTTASIRIASSFGDSDILNGGFEDETSTGSAVPANWTFHYEVSGNYSATFNRTTSNPYAGSGRGSVTVSAGVGDAIASSSVPVTAGDTYQIKTRLRAEGGQTGPFYVRVLFGTVQDFDRGAVVGSTPTGTIFTALNGNGGGASPGFFDIVSGGLAAAQNTWYPVEATVNVPAGATWMRLALYTWVNGSGGWVGNFDGVEVRKQLTSTTIADGAITTRTMTADTISGDRIQTNTLNAQKIAAGVLNASSYIQVGSSPYVLIDGRSGNQGIRLVNASNATVVNLNAVTGGATFTGTINATNGVFTGTIDNTAGTLNGGTIVGATIKTANSGTRVELGSAIDAVRFYGATSTTPASISVFDEGTVTGIELRGGGNNMTSLQMSRGIFAVSVQNYSSNQVYLAAGGSSLSVSQSSIYLNAAGSMQIGNGGAQYPIDLYGSTITLHGATTFQGSLNLQTYNAGLEMGSSASANTPYIDFHSSGYSLDYDTRIIASGGNSTTGYGTLDIYAGQINLRASGAAVAFRSSGDLSGLRYVNAAGFYAGYADSPSYAIAVTGAILSNSTINANGGIYDAGNRVYSSSNPPPASAAPVTSVDGRTGAVSSVPDNKRLAYGWLDDGWLLIRSSGDYNHRLQYGLSGRDGPDLRGFSHVGFQVGQYSTTAAAMRVDGSANMFVGGTGSFSQSTIKVKKNVTAPKAGTSLTKIKAMQPKHYKRTDTEDEHIHLGFIAEEIVAHAPELVMRDFDGSPIAVNYAGLTPYLIHAMQELSATVEALSAKIAKLEKKV